MDERAQPKKISTWSIFIGLAPIMLPPVVAALAVHLGWRDGWYLASILYAVHAAVRLVHYRNNTRAENFGHLAMLFLSVVICISTIFHVQAGVLWLAPSYLLLGLVLKDLPKEGRKQILALVALAGVGCVLKQVGFSDNQVVASVVSSSGLMMLCNLYLSKTKSGVLLWLGGAYWFGLGLVVFFIPFRELMNRTALLQAAMMLILFVGLCRSASKEAKKATS